jgi:hypothetical protein
LAGDEGVNWFRNWICRRMGWETCDEAHARIAAGIERDYPIEKMREDSRRKENEAHARREAVRARNDHDGEYQRGMEGFQ